MSSTVLIRPDVPFFLGNTIRKHPTAPPWTSHCMNITAAIAYIGRMLAEERIRYARSVREAQRGWRNVCYDRLS